MKLLLPFIFAGVFSLSAQVKTLSVASPDKSVVYQISTISGVPQYTITRLGKSVLGSSNLGLVVDEKMIIAGSTLQLLHRSKQNERYATRGFHSIALNHYNGLLLKVNGTIPYQLEIRVFNDGVAFRYILEQKGKSVITKELTTFAVPGGSMVWSQDNIKTYEGNYKQQKIEDVSARQIAGPPLTYQLKDKAGYAAITESGVTDFAGMSLMANGNQTYQAHLTGTTTNEGEIKTPWRVILVGADLNQLVNADVISNVASRPDSKLFPRSFATDWIKPGKSVWSWIASNGDVSFPNMKKYSDLASDLGFSYNLVDDGWAKWQDGAKDKWDMLKELVDYSIAKGVKIWLWKAYPDRNGDTGIKDSTARDLFFKKCKEIGIVGLKIDFFDTETQEVNDFYQTALRDAAKYQLMLNFHGANKPAGQNFTWPNEMTRESVMGLENNTHWAKHNTTLLFTRFLAGHADYTPLSFSEIVKGTTLTHQIATVAAFNSPLMCLAVHPELLLRSNIKTIIQQIPVTWDETIVLPQSSIGQLAVLAKRKGKTWYLIALNGETGKTISVDLKFLGKSTYRANCYQDVATDSAAVAESDRVYTRGDTIKIELSSGGGYLARFHL